MVPLFHWAKWSHIENDDRYWFFVFNWCLMGFLSFPSTTKWHFECKMCPWDWKFREINDIFSINGVWDIPNKANPNDSDSTHPSQFHFHFCTQLSCPGPGRLTSNCTTYQLIAFLVIVKIEALTFNIKYPDNFVGIKLENQACVTKYFADREFCKNFKRLSKCQIDIFGHSANFTPYNWDNFTLFHSLNSKTLLFKRGTYPREHS